MTKALFSVNLVLPANLHFQLTSGVLRFTYKNEPKNMNFSNQLFVKFLQRVFKKCLQLVGSIIILSKKKYQKFNCWPKF